MRDETAIPLPVRRDFRQALRIYVAGRTRFWTADEKRAAGGVNVSPYESGEGGTTETEPRAAVGVPVPETLQFHRAVGTWRDEIPGGRRRPSGSRID